MCDLGAGNHVRATGDESDRRPIADRGYLAPIAQSARVGGTVNVRVGVRPDGTVSETTLLRDASLAMFECRQEQEEEQ
jgi:hypothetical protein